MVSAIFVWGITASAYVLSSFFAFAMKKVSWKISYLFFMGLVLVGTLCYVPSSMEIWLTLNQKLMPVFTYMSASKALILKESWQTLVFFRDLLPSFIVALLIHGLSMSKNPGTYSYRLMHRFSHNRLWILLVFAFGFYIARALHFPKIYEIICLNFVFFVATAFWNFGFSLIVYQLKKVSVPYWLSKSILIALPIIVGEYFLIPLFLIVGIGISDIWMDYFERDAVQMLFHLDFN